MLNLEEIDNTIEELESGDTTFSVCDKLASLYIVKEHMTKAKDLVPESNIDEQIEDIQALFVNYMSNRTSENLEKMLSTIYNMISELYHTCSDSKEKMLFKKFTNDIASIATTTII